MEELIDNQPRQGLKRPRFLTVLCILTWIGSALRIAGDIYLFNEMADLASRLGFGFSFTHAYVIRCAVSVAGSLLCIAGSLYMWKLRKVGFGLYVTGQLGPILLSAYTIAWGNGSLHWLFIVSTLIALLFIALYTLNYKHLR